MKEISLLRRAVLGTLRKPATIVALSALGLAATPARSETSCAVFFDLGNTLVNTNVAQPFPLFPTAQPTVDALQALGIPVGIITNVPAGWDRDDLEAILAQPTFLDEFDVLVLSSQAPAAKPDPAIYHFAHEQLPPSLPAIGSTVFVGETLSEIANTEIDPTLGARAAGMIGIHLSGVAPSPLADFTIASLDDLLDVATLGCVPFRDGFESGGTDAWSDCAACG